jgi:hypothetical protein
MIITSPALTAAPVDDEDLTFPVLCWGNLVDIENITATTEEDNYPATNLANPSTNLIWRGVADGDQYLTALIGLDLFDYLAVARHNFGTLGILVSVEILVDDSPEDWDEVIAPQVLPDDAPVIFRFLPQNTDSPGTISGVRLRLQPDPNSPAVAPEAAVLFVGKSLVFERGMQGTYTPLPFGRTVNVISGRAESGDFLGRIVTGSKSESSATFRGLTPAWVRATLDPFLEAAAEQPFFFAWSPDAFPLETGFAWLDNDPQPGFDLDGYVEIDFQMTGIVE